jgi:hypothetical protein
MCLKIDLHNPTSEEVRPNQPIDVRVAGVAEFTEIHGEHLSRELQFVVFSRNPGWPVPDRFILHTPDRDSSAG